MGLIFTQNNIKWTNMKEQKCKDDSIYVYKSVYYTMDVMLYTYMLEKQLYWDDNSNNEDDRHANIHMNYK